MININLGDIVVTVEGRALACNCTHDLCSVKQDSQEHYELCECPKVEGLLAVSVAPLNDDSLDSILWAHVSKEELLEKIDQLRFGIEANFDQ